LHPPIVAAATPAVADRLRGQQFEKALARVQAQTGDKDADNPGEARGKQQDLRCLCALLLKIMHLSFQTASDINGILTGAN